MRRFLPGLLWLSVTTAAATTVGAAVRMAVHRVDGGSVPVMEAKASPESAPDQAADTTSTVSPPSTEVAAAVHATVTASTTAPASRATTSTTRGDTAAPPASSTTTTTRAVRTTTTAPAPAPTATTTSTVPPSTTTTVPTYTYEAKGGTVAVQCNGNDVSMVYANPAGGYGATVDNNGPRVVDVTFDSHGHHSEIRVTCSAGTPQPTVTERGS